MVLNLGGFHFSWKQTDSISLESEFGIADVERIGNHPALFRQTKGRKNITINAHTLPNNGDGNKKLSTLYALASLGHSYPLTTGTGKYLGRYAIVKIAEQRATFTREGYFLSQSFTLELKKDYDA